MLKYLIISLLFLTNITLSTGIYIRVCNYGGYLARCYFESEPLPFELRIYRYDTGLFPVLQCSRIDIPFIADFSRLECKALTFIAVYSTIFIHELPYELLNTCYTVAGTILNPTWSKTRC